MILRCFCFAGLAAALWTQPSGTDGTWQGTPHAGAVALRLGLHISRNARGELASTLELPGLNHLFEKCNLCTPGEYGKLEETFSPAALEVMGDWLVRHTRSQS